MNKYSFLALAWTTKSWIILGIVFAVTAIAVLLLKRYGDKLQRQQDQAQTQIDAMKQTVSILVIDKKKLKPKESGLPESALSQLPWYAKRSRLPIVKAKIGPQFFSLMCDPKVFEIIPLKKECKISLSGIYITELKSVRGGRIPDPPQKEKFFKRIFKKKDK